MRIVVRATADAAAAHAAALVAAALRARPTLVLGLPTGRTPIPFYRSLVARHRIGRADFSRATTFNLDEFAGLAADHPGSYHAYMREHLFDRVNLSASRRHVLDGAARPWRREAARFERALAAAGGLDLVVLGIGRNGHIGFNEPSNRLSARTHRVALRRGTRRANAGRFGGRADAVPTHALSMGMATILGARRLVLLATGTAKANIVRRALAGPITTRVPASLVQTHPDAIVVLDRAAAARLVSAPAG